MNMSSFLPVVVSKERLWRSVERGMFIATVASAATTTILCVVTLPMAFMANHPRIVDDLLLNFPILAIAFWWAVLDDPRAIRPRGIIVRCIKRLLVLVP